jgi:hypothetical protein
MYWNRGHMILLAMHSEWEWFTRTIYDPAIFWSMVAAIATVVLLIVAWRQLRSLAKTSRSDFLYRLKSDFFTKEARQLVFLANEDLLDFHVEPDIPYFEIVERNNPGVTDRLKELDIEEKSISIYSVDDALLGPMEDIAVFEKLKLIGRDEVYGVAADSAYPARAKSLSGTAFLDWWDDRDRLRRESLVG